MRNKIIQVSINLSEFDEIAFYEPLNVFVKCLRKFKTVIWIEKKKIFQNIFVLSEETSVEIPFVVKKIQARKSLHKNKKKIIYSSLVWVGVKIFQRTSC